ncbi:MAG: hypothetical protein HC800_24620 [Phormidesmis sp. RL_2_1]|nr:hypothetical protein [Phormidesmis sp. RL_2_1]
MSLFRSQLTATILRKSSCAFVVCLLGTALFARSLKATAQASTPDSSISAAVISQQPPSPPARFSDIAHYWAQPCIEESASQGLLKGYPDGRFAPEETFTRAQFAAIAIKAFPNANPVRPAPNFRDIPAQHWAKGAIAQAYRLGFLSGYPDNTFQPDQPITKVQALTILANAQALSPPATYTNEILQAAYQDHEAIPSYGRGAIAAATVKGLVINYPVADQLRPNQALVRAEAAALFCQMNTIRSKSASLLPAQYVVWLSLDANNRPTQLSTLLNEWPLALSENLVPQLQLQVVDRQLFITANNNVNSPELWLSDGTVAGTSLVKSLPLDARTPNIPAGRNVYFLGVLGSQILFITQQYAESTLVSSLWSSDGTAAGTIVLSELNPTLGQALDRGAKIYNGLKGSSGDAFPFVLEAQDSVELWQTDGTTAAGTRLVKN